MLAFLYTTAHPIKALSVTQARTSLHMYVITTYREDFENSYYEDKYDR